MIITLTPNPSIDRAFDLTDLKVGEVNRAHAVHVDAGGKGINVSRALVANRVASTAVLPVGGEGSLLVSMLEAIQVPTVPIPVSGETRSNITLVDSSGATTKINAPGPNLSSDDTSRLFDVVASLIRPGDVVLGAGSLPVDTPADFYVRLGEVVAKAGGELVVDTSGAPLKAAVASGLLSLIKPNEDELAELVGEDITTIGQVITAARNVIELGTTNVLVSLGAHGAMLVTATQSWWAGGPSLVPASTVGAGDVTLAGFLSRPDAPLDERLKTAIAWGRAAVMLPGTAVPTEDLFDYDVIRVIPDPDPTLTIKEM